MKKLIYCLFFLLPSMSLAQSGYENKDKQLEFSLEEKPAPRNYTPEFALYYFRTGYSVGSIGKEKGNFTLGAIGTRRYADDFFYGLEYASHFGLDGLQSYTLGANMGIHLFTLRHRIKPYFGGGFGYTSITDKGDQGRPSANGISLNGEIGLEVWSSKFFTINQGLKMFYTFLNKEEYGSSSFQELYLQLNFRF